MTSGCICCYSACDCDDITVCWKGQSEFLCCMQQVCCACNEKPIGCGMITDEEASECCKIGLYCYACGCKKPQVLCANASQCLCLYAVRSLPFDKRYLDKCVCAYYCLQFTPRTGCCTPPPDCPTLKKDFWARFDERQAVKKNQEMAR